MNEPNAQVCRSCGARAYPGHARCRACGGADFDMVPVGGNARLITYTRVHMLSLAYTERFITLGIVEFDNGLRALGRLLVEEPEIGMSLRSEMGVVREQGYERIEGLCFT
jgi:uncharacterized OB-fold protein